MKSCLFFLSYPWSVDDGGGKTHAKQTIHALQNLGVDTKPFDWTQENGEDFSHILVFGFSLHTPEIFRQLKRRYNSKIVVIPIFDRPQSRLTMKISHTMGLLFPLDNVAKRRKELLTIADKIMVNNTLEKHDFMHIFGIPKEKIIVNHLGLPLDLPDLYREIQPALFQQFSGLTNYIFFPAANVTERKNQLFLLCALKDTSFPLVLTGTENIQPSLKKDFDRLIATRKNTFCYGRLERNMLISAYKGATAVVQPSRFETAGIVAMEAVYCGAPTVVSDIPVFREYLGDAAIYLPFHPRQWKETLHFLYEGRFPLPAKRSQEEFYEKHNWTTYAKNLIETFQGIK
ncbi:glycosyltransferase [Thermospira aquatica]|uniref:Glycosyltransferase n=1 Tax=Thermospira aquatica TaxID=2828656 RepID=A0AAX3BEU9_9SPIR|nr:glycosyltransferase [Thermospira aquatica]URA10867.1 glycosyltransferase [Thermospira aquatica]